MAALVAALVQWDHVATHGADGHHRRRRRHGRLQRLHLVILAIAMLLDALVADGYLRREGMEGAEFHVLAMVSASGAMLMGMANDLIIVFLGLEILSIALYVLTAFNYRRAASGEAGPQVLHPGRLLLGHLHLRHRPDLRGHRARPT